MRQLVVTVILLSSLAANASAIERVPVAVSPGSTSSVVGIESRCPTFSWGEIAGATGYELIVYGMDGGGETREPILRRSFPASVYSWTPSLESCLDRGGRYAWSVRALRRRDASDWSAPSLFQVVAGSTAKELDEALAVVQQYLGRQAGHSLGEAEEGGLVEAGSTMSEGGGSAAEPSPAAAAATQLSVDGGIEATSFTGDGSTLTALDPANLSAGTAAIDISGSAAVLSTTLEIDSGGTGATTAEGARTSLGAASAASLVAHAGSGDHDGRYFTETELSSSGAGGAVHWENVAPRPAGLDDGDDDTTYTAGPGLALAGTQFSLGSFDAAPAEHTLTTLDSTGIVGWGTSITIGSDGLGLISYRDETNDDLEVAHCGDVACSTAILSTLDSTGDVGSPNSITIGTDGFGLISYRDNTNADLKVIHCSEADCSTATTTTLDSAGNVGGFNSVTIGADGFGLISYYDATNGALKVAHCTDTTCSAAGTYTLDSTGDVGFDTSVTIGADGFGLISYYDVDNSALKVAHCANIACSSATAVTLDSAGFVGENSSVTIGSDGLGLISYFDGSGNDLKVAHCSNITCSLADVYTLDSSGSVGRSTSVTIGADGLGLISYHDESNLDLKVAHCTDTACSSATSTTLDSAGHVGWNTSVTMGGDGLGLISYFDFTNGDLKVAHCANPFCVPYFNRR